MPGKPRRRLAGSTGAGRPISLGAFLHHAELFGCECVYGTAAGYLNATELLQLKVELYRIAAEHRSAKRPSSWWQDLPRIDASDIALLHARGATPDEIATMVGRSRAAVYKALERQAETRPRDHRAMEECDVV